MPVLLDTSKVFLIADLRPSLWVIQVFTGNGLNPVQRFLSASQLKLSGRLHGALATESIRRSVVSHDDSISKTLIERHSLPKNPQGLLFNFFSFFVMAPKWLATPLHNTIGCTSQPPC